MRRITLALLLLLSALAHAAVVVPADVSSGRVHLPVSVEGNAPGRFALDTGAGGSPLDADYAQQLGIRGTGRGQAFGASGAVAVSVVPKLDYKFAGIKHRANDVTLIPLGPVSLRAGRPMNGILGYDVLRRFVTEIDYAGSKVTFYEPREYKAPANATAIPIDFHHNIPRVRAKLTLPDGRTVEATLIIDTGAGAALVLARRFHEKHGIATDGAIEGSFGLGVGGATKEKVTRITKLEFGGFTIDNPVTTFSGATGGVLAGENADGLIGGEVLRRFTLTTDYAKKRILLAPNARYGEASEFDMSGVMLTTRDHSYAAVEVFNILPNSPAADAGLRIGDEVRAIDGVALKPDMLHEVRKLMKQPDKTYTLTIVRNGEEQQIKLTTRRMV